MTSFTSIVEVRMIDLGRDAVAQQQSDGRVVVAVRPHQSFPHAVEKVKEAVERARGTAITAEEVRRLLRPHWPEELRGGVTGEQRREALPGSPRRRRTDWPEPDAIPDAPQPISMRVPLRRRNVQLGVLFTGVMVLASGFLLGWAAQGTHTLLSDKQSAPNDKALWQHELFSVFKEQGAECSVTSPNRATCIDINGTVLAGEAMRSGDDTTIYHFFYGDGMRASFYIFEDPDDVEVWAYREGAGEDLAYVVGNVLVAGEDEDLGRIFGYAKVIADHYDRKVEEYGSSGPPTVVYSPRA